MRLPLLQTKLYIPSLRQPLVARPAVTAKLDVGVMRPVTLVAAPAGFGKTTLVSAWIAQATAAVAWLSLDEDDNDPTRFLTYMLAALQSQQPAIGAGVQELLNAPQAPPPKAMLTLLLNDLDALTTPLALVLDDYHLITAPAIHEALAFFIDHLPPTVHLILTTRLDPPLPLARWRARNQLVEIRANDLRFRQEEAATFLNEMMGLTLTATEIATLAARTEGWIAGLQLAALSMQGRNDLGSFIKAFTGSHVYVVDYLVEEVLHRQPAHVQHFLCQTSILERLSGALCDAVTGFSNSQTLLEKLQQNNLFIIPLDDERKWYRYHHLFVEVLRTRLQQTAPVVTSSVAELHHRASLWYEQQGLLGEAIDHALAGDATEQAVQLLEQMGMTVFGQGASHYLLNRWLAALPLPVVRTRPKLCLLQAWLLFNRMEPTAALAHLDEAEQALQAATMPAADTIDARNLWGEITTTRAIITTLGRAFEPDQIKRWAQTALRCLRPDNASYRGLVFGTLGTAAMQQGDVAQAAENFAEAATISRAAGHEYMALATVVHLTNMQRVRGSLRLAITACQQTLAWAAEHGAQNSFGAGNLLIQLADLLRERNDLAAALHHATAGIALAHQGAHPSLWMIGSLVLVRIKSALGEWESVFEALLQIRQMAAPLSHADWLVTLLPSVEAHLRLLQGDVAAAWQWAQQADWAEPVSGHFRGTHHFVYAGEYGGITRAQVWIAQLHRATPQPGALAEVLAYLERRGQVAVTSGLGWLRIKVHILQALVYRLVDDLVQAQAHLQQALILAGGPMGAESYIRIFVDEGEPLRLLLLGYQRWLTQQPLDQQQRHLLTYIEQLLAAFGAVPATEPTSSIQNLKVVLSKVNVSKTQNLVEPLTPRELEVLQLIAAGHSNREIARTLVVSLGTVKKHLSNIFGKLATESRTQTVARARELQLL